MNGNRWWAMTFCTPEFEAVTLRWREMVMDLGGTPVIVRRDSTGEWERNTGLKPAAMIDALGVACPPLVAWDDRLKTQPEWLVFTDADAEIHAAPVVPHLDWDIGLVDNPNPHHRNRITAAVVFVRTTDAARRFLWDWAQRCAISGGVDHPQLTRTIEQSPPGVRMAMATGWMEWSANGLSEVKPTYRGGKVVE